MLLILAASVPANAANPRLLAAKISEAPKLDGRDSDVAWTSAKPVEVTAKGVMPDTRGTSSRVTLRAAYSDTHIYLLAQWTDETCSESGHKTWIWDEEKQAYVEDADREDALSIAFEHTGPFTANMLSGEEAVWDVWHWKAFRTNPQGFAMDRSHHYFKTKPDVKANRHTARNGGDIWIARPEDDGDTVELKRVAPTRFQGVRVPQYIHGDPTGSAANVRAKGYWDNGIWTLELARILDTSRSDDTAFDPSRSYKFAVGVHNDTGNMDKASEIIELAFE